MRKLIILLLLIGVFPIWCVSSVFTNKNKERIKVVDELHVQWYIRTQCGACYTKSDLDLFTKYANRNDVNAIDAMIRSGRIVVVNPGPCKMLRAGILTSYIEYKNKKLYIATGFLTSDKNKVEWKR